MLRTLVILILVALFAPLMQAPLAQTQPDVPPLPDNYSSALALFSDSINQGSIDDSTPTQIYVLLVAEGDEIVIRVTRISGDFIPMLTLRAADERLLDQQYSGDVMGRTVELTFAADQTRWLYVVIERDPSNPSGSGTYEINLTGATDLLGVWLRAETSAEPDLLAETAQVEDAAPLLAAPLLGDLLTPTFTPTFTSTPTFTPSHTPTDTLTPTLTPSPTETFTLTNTPSPTFTPTNTRTSTPTLTPSDTPIPTLTPLATSTPSNTPRPTATDTNTPRPTSTFTATRRPTSTPRPTETPIPLVTRAIEYGVSLDAYLYQNTSDYWTFYGFAGETVRINMTGEFDTLLNLYDPNDAFATSNDDSNGTLNSEIIYVLPETGMYTIEARGFSSESVGNYTLALATITPGSMATIAYGGQINGDLVIGEREAWTFSGTQGDTVTIFLYSTDFDSYVYLYTSSDMLLGTDDDTGGDLDSSLTYTLPYTGTYSIVAASYGDNGTGSYTLHLWQEARPPTSSLMQLSYGDSVTGTLASGGSDAWAFSGTRGDRVTILLTSTDFDSYVYLYSANDVLLDEDDDLGGNFDSLIDSYQLPATGTYTIVATSFQQGGGGNYVLQLTRASGSSSSGGESIAGTCGGRQTLFTAGDRAVVDFNDGGALRILTNYQGGARQTLAQAYDNNELELLEGPICYDNSWYWRVRLTSRDVIGWVAENNTTDRWLCPYNDPECTS